MPSVYKYVMMRVGIAIEANAVFDNMPIWLAHAPVLVFRHGRSSHLMESEMADKKSMLCVGGPRAGQRYAVLYGSGFRVPIKLDVPENDPNDPEWQPNKPVKVEFADYREETFHTPQGDTSFWVPQGHTPLETITMLLEAYEATAEIEKLRGGLDAAIRAANLAIFVIRKQGVMPNSSWQSGFEKDLATATAARGAQAEAEGK